MWGASGIQKVYEPNGHVDEEALKLVFLSYAAILQTLCGLTDIPQVQNAPPLVESIGNRLMPLTQAYAAFCLVRGSLLLPLRRGISANVWLNADVAVMEST
jgi:hypothetical protein